MAAAPATLKIHVGQRLTKKWSVGPRGGPYWSFAGYTVRMQVRDGTDALVFTRSTSAGEGITITGAGSEFITLDIPESITATLTVGGCYAWDLWPRSATGTFHEPILSGKVAVLKRVTL